GVQTCALPICVPTVARTGATAVAVPPPAGAPAPAGEPAPAGAPAPASAPPSAVCGAAPPPLLGAPPLGAPPPPGTIAGEPSVSRRSLRPLSSCSTEIIALSPNRPVAKVATETWISSQ